MEFSCLIFWEPQNLRDGVNIPDENCLHPRPYGITLPPFILGNWVLLMGVGGHVGYKDAIFVCNT